MKKRQARRRFAEAILHFEYALKLDPENAQVGLFLSAQRDAEFQYQPGVTIDNLYLLIK